jgi:gluconate 2-dehydrogenase subunit 3-like protein
MDRRSAIRCSLAVAAGIFLVPSCRQEKSKPTIALKNMDISGDQESFLADLAETIIPKTSTPGAKDISSHLFALMMVDDCYDPDAQKKFVAGLAQFETLAKNKFGSSFTKCTQSQKEELLKAMENKTGIPDEALSFYNSMKKLTVQSFTTSQYFLTKIHVYELVPARFHGCVPVTKSN